MSARHRTRRATRLGGCALPASIVGLLVLAACGGSDDTDAAAVPTSSDAPTPTTAAPAPAASEAPPPTTEAPTPTTEAPTPTTAASPTTTTTFAPVETSLPTTTTTTTLVVEAPPPPGEQQPISPPLDSHAQEPIIEVGSIVIPKIGVDMTMYEGIRLSTLDYGPGHWPGTAMPGQAGNVVVGGHRTSSHRVFRDVDQLEPGDQITFRDATGEHTYSVDRVEIVEPTAVWIVDPTETATATLFACHPPGSTAQRIVVFADLLES